MKNAILVATTVLSLSIMPLPAAAQDAPAQEETGWVDWAWSFLGEDIANGIAPAIGDIRSLAAQFGPAIAPAIEKLVSLVDDMTNYELPEMLENGDIIIRRKPESPAIEPEAVPGSDI